MLDMEVSKIVHWFLIIFMRLDGLVVTKKSSTRDSQTKSNSSSPKKFHAPDESKMSKMLPKAYKRLTLVMAGPKQ